MNRPEFSNRRCAVSAAASCDHHWAWVKPSGTNASARICQLCHSPDPDWLNHIVEVDIGCEGTCVHCEFGTPLSEVQR